MEYLSLGSDISTISHPRFLYVSIALCRAFDTSSVKPSDINSFITPTFLPLISFFKFAAKCSTGMFNEVESLGS